MACETCQAGKIDWYYNTADNKFYTNAGCAGAVNNWPCTDGTGYGCTSMCAGCGGPYFTTNGSAVVSCFTNSSCTTPCVTVNELPFSRYAPWGWVAVPTLVLLILYLARRCRLTSKKIL